MYTHIFLASDRFEKIIKCFILRFACVIKNINNKVIQSAKNDEKNKQTNKLKKIFKLNVLTFIKSK